MFKRWLISGALGALVLAATTATAYAETLMMPKRDALKGTSVVVWGVTTLPNGSNLTVDYGDGVVTPGLFVGDRSYITLPHVYLSAGTFTAKITVTSGATTESATAAVRVLDGAIVTADTLRGLKINMAIQDGLRYLWMGQTNRQGNFPAGVTTNFRNGSSYDYADTSLIVLAFQNHGYKLPSDGSAPTGLYEKYLVRRGLNYVMASLSTINLGVQTAGNPCVGSGAGWTGADCKGLTTTTGDNHSGYGTPVAMLPFAASGALNRVNTEVAGATAGKTFGEILQRLVNTQAWGQTDAGAGRGGWGYSHNGGQFDGSTVGWAILGFLDAEAAGATVPAFVRTEFAFGLNGALNVDGSFDYSADSNPNTFRSPGPQKVGIGLQGLFFIGDTGSRVGLVKTNINSWWNGGPGIGQNAWGGPPNKGSAYSMFNNFKGLKLSGISTLPAVSRADRDWYADYQDWLVANQTTPNTTSGGHWSVINFSCCYSGNAINTAIAELILSPVALVLPDEAKFASAGLSPLTDTKIEGGNHTVIAKAESAGGTPVAGATVVFTVLDGPNVGVTGSKTTGSDGTASFTYTSTGGPGTDHIQAKIGNMESNTVEMIWKPKNAPPVATDDAYTVDEDTALSGNVTTNDTDPDGDSMTATQVSGVSNGTLVFNADGSFTYTPNANWFGTDSFTYKLNDGKVDSNVATATIVVRSVNDVPVANNSAFTTPEDTAYSGAVFGSDVDGDPLTYAVATGPAHGTVTLASNGSYTYAPTLNYNGPDSFTFTVSDGNGGSATGTVTITVTPVNDAPVANNSAFTTPEDTSYSGAVSGSDVDGDALTYAVATGPAHGTVTLASNGSYTYAPALNYNGPDSFTFTVSDGKLSATGTVTITVTPVNDNPVCTAASPSISILWPPNHKLVDVSVLGVTDPVEGTATTITITSIRQDEPTNTVGDGNTPIDGYGIGGATAQVRAERSGSPKVPGDGRVYHIGFTGTDAEGGTCTGTVKVGVPHDQGQRRVPVDGGPIYKSSGN